MRCRQVILYLAVWLFTAPCAAVEQVDISGLLGRKAVLIIDGTQRIVATGETSPEGVELEAVEADGVRLKIDGKSEYYPLGSSRVATQFTKPEKAQERVYKDSLGMFRASGSINGTTVDFLVDTGATSIAMNSAMAKRVGVNYLLDGDQMYVQTAQGVSKAWHVKLDRVRIGQIELTNIDAAVLEGGYPVDVLLGMSFLGRLNVQHQGEVMVLETKF